jgi:hypothetical protein
MCHFLCLLYSCPIVSLDVENRDKAVVFWISPQEIKLRAASINLSNVRMFVHTEGTQGVEFSTAVWP